MSVSIRVNDDIYESARKVAKAEYRTIANQIEFWAMIGKTALDNPDLSINTIKELLIAKAQDKNLAEPFTPE